VDRSFETALEAAMVIPAVVEQATGVLSTYRKASSASALAELVDAARAHGVSLTAVAEAVVAVATDQHDGWEDSLLRMVLARWDGLAR